MIGRLLRVAGLTLLGSLLLACGLHVAHSGGPDPAPPPDGTLRVTTLNVHWIALREETGRWSVAGWEARKGPMTEALRAVAPDILALQEAESFPATNRDGTNLVVAHLTAAFPGLGVAASGPPDRFPPTQPVLYAKDRLQLVDQGWFFFSETPDEIYSRTFDGSYPAFASWAEFVPIGGPRFRVVNVHTDYASRDNRLRSAALVRDRIAPVIAAGTPVIVTGDLNALRGAATLDLIEEAGIAFLPVRGATYHLDRGLNLFGAIDHIGISAGLSAAGPPVVLRDRFGAVWPSDHYPVYADIRLAR